MDDELKDARRGSWKPILITLASGFILSLSSCFGLASGVAHSNNTLAGICALGLVIGVVVVLGAVVAAVIRVFRTDSAK